MTEADMQQQHHSEPMDEELDLQDASGRTIVVDPNPMNEIMKKAEQLRSETSDGVVYPCEFCQKVFKFKYEYERHAKIHSGDRPWQCPECMKTFSRKDNMRAHMKIHTGELVRHICQLCGKSYGRKYDLQVHERVHTGERPFECGSCGKSFISTSRLRAHQLIHCKNIYLPRHVRNKRLHLMKRRAREGRSDSPTDSIDGGSSGAGGAQDEDDDEYDEDYDEDEFGQGSEDSVDSRSKTTSGVPPAQQRGKQQQQQQQLPLVQQKSTQLETQPSISLIKQPARHISISVVPSCRPPAPPATTAAMDDPLGCPSPEAPSSDEIENRLQLLEAELMRRKAELAGRGVKLELYSLLGAQEFNHADFRVVLPTEACKDEPC